MVELTTGPPVDVSAIIVTRGDVDLLPVIDSLPNHWEVIVWDNAPLRTVAPPWASRAKTVGRGTHGGDDLSVFGRYAAIEHATHKVIYVQDDDCIVSQPEKITWGFTGMNVVCNMPPEFRHDFYTDHSLVGFGACFHRDDWRDTQERWEQHPASRKADPAKVLNCFDVIFTTLAKTRTLVHVPHVDREFASDPNRMWKQPNHSKERTEILELAKRVRGPRRV